MKQRSQTLTCIVLKRSNLGETDRIVTLITQEQGKIACIAKGVRKLSSSTRASLEPGNLVKAHLIFTKGMPLLVQSKLVEDAASCRVTLPKIRQLSQILEIIDKLFVEEELPQPIFQLIIKLRSEILCGSTSRVRHYLDQLITRLGFPSYNSKQHQTVLEYVQEIAERPMRSFQFLQPAESATP